MCKAEVKSPDHLLLHSPFCKNPMGSSLQLLGSLGVSSIVSNFVKNHLFGWESIFGRKAQKNVIVLPHGFGAIGVKETEGI